jgi:hypothetical protein
MPSEQSPGGSAIHRYAASHWAKPQVGIPDASSLQFAQAREKAYPAFFGESQSIFHEIIPLVHTSTFTHSNVPAGKAMFTPWSPAA